MYRKAGSQSALSGVLSGPYTGGRRVIDVACLAEATRKRVADALAGRGESTPIAHVRANAWSVSLRAAVMVTAALMIGTTTFLIGFENPQSRWLYHSYGAFAIWCVAGLLFAFGMLEQLRRRAQTGQGALLPGSYLLTLDIVDVGVADVEGAQRIELTPLGDARDAKVTTKGRYAAELIISFVDQSTRSFVLRGDGSPEQALRRLEHTQSLLEELTYVSELGKAFAHDPFFDLRVDASWSEVAPSSKRESTPVRWIFRPYALALAAALGLALAGTALYIRNELCDRTMLREALIDLTPEAMDRYIARGGRDQSRARAVKAMLLEQREKEELALKEKEAREKAKNEPDFMGNAGAASAGARSSCAAALEQKGNKKNPEVTRALGKLLTTSSESVIPIRFKRTVKGVPSRLYGVEDHLLRRELTVAQVFERVFSEVCAGNVLRFVFDATDKGTVLAINYEVSWPVSDHILPLDIFFDVSFRGSGEQKSFRLTMPEANAPKQPRRQSLFTIPKTTGGDELLFWGITAWAFDRLYDEIWSLFFAGDPRVPVADPFDGFDASLPP